MKLQYHKIRGVDKSVCTAEQKIAYNMSSPGPSSALLPKTKKMPAIGPPLTASLPTANMIWNAAIITDVQLFALACYNVWLYNPIINQTAKQNYFSVFTKLFKSKSA